MGQISFTLSLVFIALASVALIGFATNFALDNDSPVSLSDDEEISGIYSEARGNLSAISSQSESTFSSIVNSTITSGGGTAGSIAPFTLTASNTPEVTKNIIRVGYLKIFGNDSGFGIFMTTFFAMITLIIGLFLYKTLRGNPD